MAKNLEQDQFRWNFLKGVLFKCPLSASSLVEGEHCREHSVRIIAPRAGVYSGRTAGRCVANVNIVQCLSVPNNEPSLVCCDLKQTIKMNFICFPFCSFETFRKLLPELLLG